MGTKRTHDSKAFPLFGKSRGAILALLYGRADEAFYLRQIVRAVAAGQGAVQRELATLADAGVIERFERDKQVYYRANRGSPFFPELRSLMIKTGGMAGVLAEALRRHEGSIAAAFIYGSQADGTATVASDIDFFVVGEIDEMALHRAIAKAERSLGRAVNYTLLSRQEFEKRRREKGGFIARVTGGPRISVIGNADEI